MSSALVIHPGLQHSHQLAWALYERGLLQKMITGVPIIGSDESGPPWWLPNSLRDRVKRVGIPSVLKMHPTHLYALQRLVYSLSSDQNRQENIHRALHAFDFWASKRVLRFRPKVVVAFENSAYHTFRAAKEIGATCILDLPSIERRAAELLIPTSQSGFSMEINTRKDAEIRMADLILTCSNYAADTYADSGVEREKIRALPLGATIVGMHPPRSAPDKERLSIAFAGSFNYRKSGDVILEVFERLALERVPITLDIVGGLTESSWLQRVKSASNIKYHGQQSQSYLFQILRNSDCLVLPSRFDSFGMVVAESLACGTPVIVSTNTGAKEIVETQPGAGWVIEPTAQGLYDCLTERWKKRDELQACRQAAFAASKNFTWENYRFRVGEAVEAWLQERVS